MEKQLDPNTLGKKWEWGRWRGLEGGLEDQDNEDDGDQDDEVDGDDGDDGDDEDDDHKKAIKAVYNSGDGQGNEA